MKNFDTSLDTSQSIEFCRQKNLKFVFQPIMSCIIRVSLTSKGYKSFILNSSQDTKTQLENSYIIGVATTFLWALGFCNQVLPNIQDVLK